MLNTHDQNDYEKIPFKDIENYIQKEITDIIFSPNMKYMVTSSEDDESLVMWTIDIENNIIKKETQCKCKMVVNYQAISLLGLLNNKLLILGYENNYYGYSNLTIRDMGTLEDIAIKHYLTNGHFLQLLPNGDLLSFQAQYIHVVPETHDRYSTNQPNKTNKWANLFYAQRFCYDISFKYRKMDY
ncbi:6740_t:CDS:2 [Funneliformis mosseae]|uniref:6740_t:CDS:1 n=1 Tax=Funneliformis mosseae TaxID=27381 RepID=A0A9N9HD41_FUNMO|nr:6740_t:CDS:2 [Funneliformis mosseae]